MSASLVYFDRISAPMPLQMALDELLFEEAVQAHQENPLLKRASIRFYDASEPWVSLGYAYSGWKKDSRTHLNSPGDPKDVKAAPLCRRITGGGRVLHGRDFMFTFIAPKHLDASFGSVMTSYRKIHEVLQKALCEIGIPARFYQEDEPLSSGKDCFLHPIVTDLAVGDRKIAGGGQKRSRGMLLHQESIHLDDESLYEPLSRFFYDALLRELNCRPETGDWLPEQIERAEVLGLEKYRIDSVI